MADIKFLQDIDFTGVTAKNFVVESDASPSTQGAIVGQILFDSGNNKLAYYDGSAWVTLPDGTGQDTTYTLSASNNKLKLTDSNTTPTVDNILLEVDSTTTGSLTAASDTIKFTGAAPTQNALGMIQTYSAQLNQQLSVVSPNTPQTTGDITRNYQVWIDKDNKALVHVPWTDSNTGMTSWNLSDGTTSASVGDTETATIKAGTSGSLKASIVSSSDPTISFDVEYGTNTADKNVVTAASSTSTVSSTSQLLIENKGKTAGSSVVGRISWQNLKDDVIGGISGAMAFKGSYDNSTTNGSPNIGGGQGNATSTSGTTGIALEPGDTYVVSATGTTAKFLNEPIEIGDLIIFSKTSEVAANGAVSDSDFTIVNRNIDLATDSTAGIVSVPTGGGLAIATSGASAGQISIADQTNLPTSSQGTATKVPTITVNTKGIVTALSETTISVPSASKTMFAATSGSGTTSLTYKHSLNENVMVQVWELADPSASKQTLNGANVVYPDIEIVNSNDVKLNFASPANGAAYAITVTPCPSN